MSHRTRKVHYRWVLDGVVEKPTACGVPHTKDTKTTTDWMQVTCTRCHWWFK